MKPIAALLASALLLAGCSGSSDDAPAPATTTSAADRAQAAQDELAQKVDEEADDLKAKGTVVEIAIEDGRVTPQGERVEVEAGTPVTLAVTSDADEEIHVHSDPEHTYQVGPGDSIEKTFTLDTPGQVAVEAHHLDVTIVQLVVRP